MGDINDGKIRLRCPGCGKRVKFPAGYPGGTFRCPLCHTTIVAPIGAGDAEMPGGEELEAAATAAARPSGRPGLCWT